jgi:hypothetical protein
MTTPFPAAHQGFFTTASALPSRAAIDPRSRE